SLRVPRRAILLPQDPRRVPRDSAMNQKKARPESRADKGLEIFSVNEKVCFGKQKLQYNELTPFH
ncbi:hypothetical protein, partial [Burkholderia thailandensis]|uniref:hypothetical protein n=1 Tax=Burkholderia thailandensis TaxID=57975 RepID=UPI001C103CC9